MANSITSTLGKRNLSPEERIALADSPESWDFIYGGILPPRVTMSFEGDPIAWEQFKAKAVAEDMDPSILLKFMTYLYLEDFNWARARQRLMARLEWVRTRPVQVVDRKGARWIPLDLLAEELRRDDKAG